MAGVTIRLHVTFLALVALVAATAPSTGETAAASVGWLIALFACVVVHELSHALVARSKGIAVHEIDLLPIGGVSRLESIPDEWRDETAIAAAGPIASLALAAAFFGVAAAAALPLLPPSVWDGAVIVRLAWVNVALAAFNLLPAFPLDGGRVLRALLERNQPRMKATRRAVSVSRVLAATMIAFGLVFNIWLLVIGIFVIVAGGAEEAAVLVHAALGPLATEDIAVACPLVLSSTMTAADAARLAELHPQTAYPVADEGGPYLGLLTGAVLGRATTSAQLRGMVSTRTVEAGTSVEDAAALVASGPVAVMSGGRFIGVITADIIERHFRSRVAELGGRS